MEILFDIAAILFDIAGGFLQAIAGLLWPSDDPRVRRLQRLTLSVVLTGCIAVVGAVVLWWFRSWYLLAPLAAAALLFIIGGFLGAEIEKRCKAAKYNKDT